MHDMLLVESAAEGVLYVNGQFCGPMEREGQAFPVGKNAEVYIQLFPFGEGAPLTVALRMRNGQPAYLAPQESAFALLWPDGVVQLELRMHAQAEERQEQEEMARGTLLRYLSLRLAGDESAPRLWLRPQDEMAAPDVSAYHAAVPLRFAPHDAPERYDDRAGLVRRVADNVAVVDAALAATVPAGQGKRLIESVSILQTAQRKAGG